MSEFSFTLPESIQLVYILPLLLATVAHFLAEPMRWFIYLRNSLHTDYRVLFDIFSLTALISFSLPLKMGLPARMYLLKSKAGLRIVHCSTLLMLDGLINYTCWGFMSIAGVYLIAKENILQTNLITVYIVSLFVLAFLIFLWKQRFRLFPNAREGGVSRTIVKPYRGLTQALSTITYHSVALASCIMLLDIGSHIVRHWAIFELLGIDLDWEAIFIIATVSLFTGILSMMPMGLGGYDAMLVLLLMQFSVDAELAISVAIINRLASIVIGILTGTIGGMRLGLNPFNKKLWRRITANADSPTRTE